MTPSSSSPPRRADAFHPATSCKSTPNFHVVHDSGRLRRPCCLSASRSQEALRASLRMILSKPARLRVRLQSLGRAQASKPILKIVPCAGCPGLQPALLPRSVLGPGFFLSLVTTKAPPADAQAADGAFIFILRASPSDACRKCRPAFYVEAAALTSVRARTSQRVRLHGGRRLRCRRRRCRRGG